MPFIYLHIPKNAGNTIKMILANQYKNNLVMISPNFNYYDLQRINECQKDEIKYFYGGHLPFGLHRLFSHNMKYITLLRDPVERILSSYRYICLNKKGGFHKAIPIKERNCIESFVQNIDKYTLTHGNNAQTRLISGIQMDKGSNLIDSEIVISHEEMYNIAIQNIKTHFIFCGIIERFEESIVLMKKHLEWPRRLYFTKRNITPKTAPEVDQNTINLIKFKNSLDLKLYELIKQKLENEIDLNHGYIFKELKKININNYFYNKYLCLRKILKKAITICFL